MIIVKKLLDDQMDVLTIDYANISENFEYRILFLNIIYKLIRSKKITNFEELDLEEDYLKLFKHLLKTQYQEYFIVNENSVSACDISGDLILGSDLLMEDIDKIIKNKPLHPELSENIEERLDTFFLNWLFKYSKINYIPFTNDGINVFNTIFSIIDENELKKILRTNVLIDEIEKLPRRKNENQITKRDIRLNEKFLGSILEFIQEHSEEKKYWEIKRSEITKVYDRLFRKIEVNNKLKNYILVLVNKNPINTSKNNVLSNIHDKEIIIQENNLTKDLTCGDLVLCKLINENDDLISVRSIKKIDLKLAGKCLNNDQFSFAPSKKEIKEILLTYTLFNGKYGIKLWDHQTSAIKNWLLNGKHGIFEMATGTGKTFTALGCLKLISESENSLISIIACPFNHLITQWEKEIKSMKIDHEIIIADSTNPKWKTQISDIILDISNEKQKFLIVLTTHSTFSLANFYNKFKDVKSKLFLIVDEVHGIGTDKRTKGLLDNYDYRLGLSATPERWFDKEGTELIQKYFGAKVYEFSLSMAINQINPATGESYLTPYEYEPCFVELSSSELAEYKKITKKIVKSYYTSNGGKNKNQSGLYFKRQKILDNAINKLKSLEDILNKNKDLKHCLIYCSPEQVQPIQKILNEKNIIQHKFTMNEKISKSSKYGGISEREFLLKKFSDGIYKVLVAIRCLDEGVDIPSAKTAIMMSSTSNPIQYIQRRGRILRRSNNKEKAIIYDMIIIPNREILEETDLKDFEIRILKKELIRYKEFALAAENALDCLKIIENIGGNFNLNL